MSSISLRATHPPPTDGRGGGGVKGRIAFQTIVYNVVFFDRWNFDANQCLFIEPSLTKILFPFNLIILLHLLNFNPLKANTLHFLLHLQSMRIWSNIGSCLWRLRFNTNLQQTGVCKVQAEYDYYRYDRRDSRRISIVISWEKVRWERNKTGAHCMK